MISSFKEGWQIASRSNTGIIKRGILSTVWAMAGEKFRDDIRKETAKREAANPEVMAHLSKISRLQDQTFKLRITAFKAKSANALLKTIRLLSGQNPNP